MTIVSIEADRIEQACVACGKARAISLSEVVARSIEHGPSPVALELPACPDCRSVEMLVPSERDVSAIRAHARPHQLLVDVLAARLAKADISDELAAELEAAFPDGLRIDAAVVDGSVK